MGYALSPGALTIEKRKSSGNLRRGQRRGDGIQRGRDEIARRVFYVGIRHLVLLGVGQFHIADGAGQLLDLAGDAFVALAAEAAAGHFTEVPLPTVSAQAGLTLLR